MKKHLYAILLILSCGLAHAQFFSTANLTASAASCSRTPNLAAMLVQPIGSNTGSATITLSGGTFSATVSFYSSGNGGATWSLIAGAPIGGGSTVTSATAAGTWSFTVSGLTHLCALASTFSSGSIVTAISTSTSPSSLGSSPVAVTGIFGSNIVEVTTQLGGDIDAQIGNACTALTAAGATSGGVLTFTWNGTKTGSSAPTNGVFANCPFGTQMYFLGNNTQTWVTDVPIVLYGGMRMFGMGRNSTTIQAGSALKATATARAWATTAGNVTASGSTITFVCSANCTSPSDDSTGERAPRKRRGLHADRWNLCRLHGAKRFDSPNYGHLR